ncbi:hypothetical protein [Zavarzinella formosa]|uniref:hypothetical protein n=1 Tax=Zavarzinella formosa TaxID=360055 RepID=UPI0012F8C032|nr:hypothetical protein [Zavarzinella formosa]
MFSETFGEKVAANHNKMDSIVGTAGPAATPGRLKRGYFGAALSPDAKTQAAVMKRKMRRRGMVSGAGIFANF